MNRVQCLRRYCTAKKLFPPVMTPMLPPGTFKNKVAIVTGGGTGIGKGMTEMFAQLGASVAIMSRKQEVLDEAAKEISSKTGSKILAIAADVRDPSAVAAAMDRCCDELGLPDIVINNAAGNFISPTEMLSTNAWKTIVDIVLNGTAIVTLDVGKRLIEAGKGANFLAISATYTKYGSGYVAPSAAAKSGVKALMMCKLPGYFCNLHKTWPWICCVKCSSQERCGSTHDGAFSRLDPDGHFSKEAVKGAIKRQGEITEVVNLATYLVSDYSSWLTGEVIRMDGGHLNQNASVFNRLSDVPKDQWKVIEAAIRSAKGS